MTVAIEAIEDEIVMMKNVTLVLGMVVNEEMTIITDPVIKQRIMNQVERVSQAPLSLAHNQN